VIEIGTDPMHINKSTFLITGGSSGLGEATVRALHAAGANIVIADLLADKGAALASELGESVRFYRTDVTQESDAIASVNEAKTHFGSLQGLVNCAGIGPAERVLGKSGPHRLDSFVRCLTINLVGSFNMVRIAAAAMAEQTPTEEGERGVIINTASIAAFDGQIGQAAYAASKGGLVSMTLPIARELARVGIRVVTIAPGLFLTPMMGTLPESVQDALGKATPFPQRLGAPSEYAALAQHIISNLMLNGETIRLDGAVRLAAK
jgi:NAD(P)-dependent dehydrogenase (short-subunit alcohol dehydrogenase family)